MCFRYLQYVVTSARFFPHLLAGLPTTYKLLRYTQYTIHHSSSTPFSNKQVHLPSRTRHCQTASEPQRLLFVLAQSQGVYTGASGAPACELCRLGCTEYLLLQYCPGVPAARFPSTALQRSRTPAQSAHPVTDSIKNLPTGSSAKTPLAIPLALPSSPRIGYNPLELPVGKATPVGFWIPLTNDFS